MAIHKPPHTGYLKWPSEDGWVFDLKSEFTVYFDGETGLPLAPFHQALRGGLTFGLEKLYPKVPWASTSPYGEATSSTMTGADHRRNQAKMIRRLRQWGRI